MPFKRYKVRILDEDPPLEPEALHRCVPVPFGGTGCGGPAFEYVEENADGELWVNGRPDGVGRRPATRVNFCPICGRPARVPIGG